MPQNEKQTAAPVSTAAPETKTAAAAARTVEVPESAPRLDTIGGTISNPASSPDREQEVTSDALNASAGMDAAAETKKEAPAKKGPLTVEELQEKRRMGLLTVDEAKQLNDAENAPKSDATVKQLTDNDREIKDPDKNSFKEDDVINYMYNHWLIDGAMYLDQKIRKYGAYGFERMMAAAREHRAEVRANDARIKNSSTYKTAEKIEQLHKEREDKITAQSKERANDIFRISQVIQAGTLFDPENKELLDKFDEINKSNTPEGQERRQRLEASAQKLKENPNDQEQQQAMKRDAVLFARDANINNRFDTQAQITANAMTTAGMLDDVARNKDAFPQNIEAAYDSRLSANTDRVMAAVEEKRKTALETIGEVDRKSAAALQAGMGGAQAAQMLNAQWEREHFGDFEQIQEHAKDASSRSMDDIKHGQIQEFEKEPRENKHLNKMNNHVDDMLPEDYAPSERQESRATDDERTSAGSSEPGRAGQDAREADAASSSATPPAAANAGVETDGERTSAEPRESGHDHARQGVREAVAASSSATPPVVATVGMETDGGKTQTLRGEAVVQQGNDAKIADARTAVSDQEADLAVREQKHEERGGQIQDRIARIKARAQASKNISAGEYMVDTMIAEGAVSKEQEDALLDAGIKSKEGKGSTSEERVLDHMINSGKFSEKQLDIALNAAIERQKYVRE